MEPDEISKVRHALSNPLAALLAEVQLLRMQPEIGTEIDEALGRIEELAIRMRTMLRPPR